MPNYLGARHHLIYGWSTVDGIRLIALVPQNRLGAVAQPSSGFWLK
ncbi:MAG: hypothetical protein HC827_19655 [Cyanobacteria bacterium RM1_2_2]|nr:hypothetical protein [Cyanobacteria bacterium RM1_2_2]